MNYTLSDLCRDIRLAAPVTEQVLALNESLDWKTLTAGSAMMSAPGRWQEGLAALEAGLAPDPSGFKILTCCLRQALVTREAYLTKGISQEIFVETMACFSRFVEEHMVSFGCYGFDRAFWTVRQLSALLFRVGELEYELVCAEGEHQVHLHIPSGADLRDEALDASLEEAAGFLTRYFPAFADAPMFCDSWMLSPTLPGLLPADSKIIRFQNRFCCTPHGLGDSYMQWVFRRTDIPLDACPEDTGLQRRLKAHLLSGGTWTEAVGVLK